MAYNSNLLNLYVAGLYESFCFIRPDTGCYLFNFTFTKAGDFTKAHEPQRIFDLIMENL